MIAVLVINFVIPQIPAYHGASQDSMSILHIASVGNILLSIFSANGMFAMLLNRVKPLAIMTIASAIVVSVGGIILGRFGLEYITLSYLASAALLAICSTLYVKKIFKNAQSIFFARYI
jgi:O-antigen/teichoic acid export membrane protein